MAPKPRQTSKVQKTCTHSSPVRLL
jgi:hypothetical protein